jgi:hypothetical protein
MKIISLIIYSDDLPQYKELMELSRIYNEKMNKLYDYKHFYIQLKEDLMNDYEENGDMLCFKGKDSIIPGIYDKTMRAIKYLDEKYEYDYILRTNVSSFFNIHKLFSFSESFPKSGATGILIFDSFLSGTGIILSKDVASKLSTYPNQNIHDDVLISSYLKQFTNITPFPDNRMFYLCSDKNNNISSDKEILYYRVKNNDRNIDIIMFKQLLECIYLV